MTPFLADEWLTIYGGDCRAVMAEMEPESVQCVITSPPYWGLRDYGVADQLGLEATPEQYVDAMVDVFRALRRVLRKDGTVWLNLGDSYASKARGSDLGWDKSRLTNPGYSQKAQAASLRRTGERHRGKEAGLKSKDRVMIPARVALALQADGWWLRDEIVWAKPNPMPSSVADRTTPAHEMVYLLARSERYYFDAASIREVGTTTDPRLLEFGPRPDRAYPGGAPDRRRLKVPGGWDITAGEGGHGADAPATDSRWPSGWANGSGRGHDPQVGRYAPPDGHERAIPVGRNKRSVWTVATQPYPEAHFATFPEALIEPMILAGCPAGGVVLDPFAGSGTVGLVAERLGRRSVLIDLSTDYLAQMVRRIAAGRSSGEGPALDMPVPAPSGSLWEATA